jgi:phosphoribosylformimino-5-aminoimidazole carboxamide ribotide isomerase
MAELWFERGASYIIFGTLAVENPDEVRRLANLWPDRVYIAIDARAGQVATHGWEQTGSISVLDHIQSFSDAPLAGFIYTDIERDGTLLGPDPEGLHSVVARAASRSVIVSGGVSSLDHVRSIEQAGANGAIIGKALFEGEVRLRDLVNAIKGHEGHDEEDD